MPPFVALRTDRRSVALGGVPPVKRQGATRGSALARRSANWSEQVDRAAKSELVTSLNTVLKDTGLVIVAHYAGMTVAQMTEYRQRIKEAGGKVKVTKNRLAKLALKALLLLTQ